MSIWQQKHLKHRKTWRIKPTIHMFMELGHFQTAQLGDPESYWAYKDEDFMGEV